MSHSPPLFFTKKLRSPVLGWLQLSLLSTVCFNLTTVLISAPALAAHPETTELSPVVDAENNDTRLAPISVSLETATDSLTSDDGEETASTDGLRQVISVSQLFDLVPSDGNYETLSQLVESPTNQVMPIENRAQSEPLHYRYLRCYNIMRSKQTSVSGFLVRLIGAIMSLSFMICPPAIAATLSHSSNPNPAECPDGMVLILGGTFAIGTNKPLYPEERAVEDVSVDSFCMASHEVTNAEFAQFVEENAYQTVAERPLSKEQFPDLPDEQRSPGSLVFHPLKDDGQSVEFLSWWQWLPGADWQHSEGPESTIQGKENHPVVHIAYEDAIAYATWAGKQLPTESQWEYAAKGTRKNRIFPWGNDYSAQKANTWQGQFPFVNTQQDGYLGTAPVGAFPANDYGLYDMAGNVWEWTSDWYTPTHDSKAHHVNPKGVTQQESFDPKKPTDGALHVIKGGSFLCAQNYCSRSRPAARESQAPDTGTNHIGMRLVMKSHSNLISLARKNPVIANFAKQLTNERK